VGGLHPQASGARPDGRGWELPLDDDWPDARCVDHGQITQVEADGVTTDRARIRPIDDRIQAVARPGSTAA
jgi:hypothetical protein